MLFIRVKINKIRFFEIISNIKDNEITSNSILASLDVITLYPFIELAQVNDYIQGAIYTHNSLIAIMNEKNNYLQL